MPVKSGGGWKAIAYTFRMANRVGWWKLWKAMRSKNTCKTCALGMGGVAGGMVNEGGHFPEVCKKSFQAMASDMQAGITPEFFARYGFNEMRAMSPKQLEDCGRIVEPLYAGPGDKGYRVISWDEAIGKLADKLKAAGPEHSFFYASGRSSNEAGFLLQLFSRLFGTNYVNNCSYYCHQASGVGLGSAVGVGTGTVKLEDLNDCDLYILIGGNPASNHPRLLRSLMEIKRRGGHIIVVNPIREVGLVNFRVPSDVRSLLFGTEIASLYIQPQIGGDIALLTGVAKLVFEKQGLDRPFIDGATEGFDSFRSRVESTSWDDIERYSGVSRSEIEKFAAMYLSAKNVIFGWTMGITHHLHGVENVQMIANVAMMRGMVGKPGAGFMPIRGHSNVQGIGSVGVTPVLKQALLERFEKRLGVTLPRTPGLDTMGCMDAADQGQMQVALCLGGNLHGSNPDATYAEQAIRKLDMIAYMSTTLNTTHAWGRGKETIILPVRPRDEEEQPTTQESMFSLIRLSEGGPARYPGPRSEVSVLTEIARRVLGENGPVNWTELESHTAIRELIADMIPVLEGMRDIDKTKKEFHIPGRNFHTPLFPTPTGKAQFHDVEIPPQEGLGPHQLRLMTIRSEGQFNTVVYEEEDLYRGQTRRDIILMNPSDMERMGLKEDQTVRLFNSTGEMRLQRVRPYDIHPGNAAMYCPESNVLIPRDIDPRSRTPAFKSIVINVEPELTVLESADSAGQLVGV